MYEAIGGRVWVPENPAPKKSSPNIHLVTLSAIVTVILLTLTILHRLNSVADQNSVLGEKLVSQCHLTQPDADKFLVGQEELYSIQRVKIDNAPAAVKLEDKESKMVLSNFLTDKQICSFTVPRVSW